MVRHLFLPAATVAIGLVLAASSPYAHADKRLRCESKGYRHTICGIPDHGYVRLDRQVSSTRCVQGRNWDYNHREIWVDDGCGADFVIETREHGGSHSDGAKVAAAVAALAILGVAAANAGDKDRDHDDDDRGHSGHSSYVPKWMVGDFKAYNEQVRSDVYMTIEADGRLRAKTEDVRVTGYVNDRKLYVGNNVFEVQRTDRGFDTVQVGRWSNRVSYSRR